MPPGVPPGIPQLIVMYRRIDQIKEPSGFSARIGAETVLLRLLGSGVGNDLSLPIGVCVRLGVRIRL